MLNLAAAILKPSEITVLLLSLAVLLGLARLLGEIARQLKQPAVLGEILAGIVLGPTVFGTIAPEWFDWLFPYIGPVRTAGEGLIVLSATLLLLVVGLDVDLSTVWRQGKTTLMVSAAGIIIPFSCGFTLAMLIPKILGIGSGASLFTFALFMGIALSITALPVIAKILMDLNLAKSDMGTLIISSAMLNDLVGWIGFAIVLALLSNASPDAVANPAGQYAVYKTIGLTLLFLLLMLSVGRWLAHRSLPYIQAHWSWPGGVLVFVMVIALCCAAFTEYLGIHSIFGAFIAGVAIGDSHHLSGRTRDHIHQFITNIFAPIFFASIGLRINFIEKFEWQAVLIVFLTAIAGKTLGCYLGARGAGVGKRESWAVGFGMTAQGAVGIILGELAHVAGLISQELLVAIIFMALGTSLISGPAMQKILRQKTKRTLVDLLSDRHILMQPAARTVSRIIHEMASRAAEITDLPENELFDAVLQRERIMHTGLPNGLAVPHARLQKLNKPCLIIARSLEGIDFDAPDGTPAKIICMILTPTAQPETQIEILSQVATLLNKTDIQQKLLAIKTSTEFLAVLNRACSPPPEES